VRPRRSHGAAADSSDLGGSAPRRIHYRYAMLTGLGTHMIVLPGGAPDRKWQGGGSLPTVNDVIVLNGRSGLYGGASGA
jgi:hypothetical protein